MKPKPLLALAYCLAISFAHAQSSINILFVGNSLTYYNDLPELVKVIAAQDGIILNYTMLAEPNYALIDHWNDGRVIAEIKTKQYDFVVVQQGPSSQLEGRTMLLEAGLILSKLCTEHDTQLAFYMVWPSKARSFDFDGVIESYSLAASHTKSLLCPAGKAWQDAWSMNPELRLYAPDNFHPEYKGSFLAALVIYGTLLRKQNLEFLDYKKIKSPSLTQTEFKVLRQAAQHVLAK